MFCILPSCMLKQRLKILLLILCSASGAYAQQIVDDSPEPSQNDTAEIPYWIDMMSDPTVNFFRTVKAFETYWQDRKVPKGAGYKPFKRWEFGMRLIIDGEGNIPAPGSIEEQVAEYIENNYPGAGGLGFPGMPDLGPPECLTNGQWVEIGPYSLASNRTSQPNGLGRLNAIAVHPTDSNIIYVGSPAGGLWSSNDGGKTWSSNTDTLPTLGVSSIVIDPQHPDTVYIGTGDRDASDSYGRGVLRSLDGGQTWQMSNTGMGNVVVGRMIIDPKNPGVLIAATSSGLYRTTNYGNNWTRVRSGNFKEVVMHPTNSQLVYAATYGGAAYYRSTNNGAGWTQITSGLPTGQRRMVIGVSNADTNFVYVLVTESRKYKGIYLSSDKGATFKMMSNSPNIMDYSANGSGSSGQAWYDLDVAVDPANAAVVYVAGVNIFKSTDSGQTWKINAHWVGSGGAPAIHADNHVLEFDGFNRLFTGNDGGIYKTTNGGKTYSDLSKGLGVAQIYRLSQSATRSDMVINGYQDNGTGMLDRGSWHTVMGGDGMDCEIDPSNETWAFSDLYYGDVRRYKDGYYNGRIAANGVNGIKESGGWVTPFILQEGKPSTMFIGYKNVWRSDNIQATNASSVTWTKISSGLAGVNNKNISHLENSIADPDRLYMVRSDKKLFRTDNASAATPSWTDLTSGLPTSGTPRWLESHPKFKDRVYIAHSNNRVYQSNDAGKTWKDISAGLPTIPILSLAIDSSSEIGGMYAGTYMGVFYRDTILNKWVWFNQGMPVNSRVTDLDIYYSPEGRGKSHIVSSTYGRGNWRSPLYDETQKPPIAEFNLSAESGCLSQQFDFEDKSLNTPTRWHWKIRPATMDFIDGTDSFSQNPSVVFKSKGLYSVELVAENCNGADSILKKDLIEVFDDIKATKCASVTVNKDRNYGMGVFEVEVDKFLHQSGGVYEEGEYVDLGCKEVIELLSDTTYDIKVFTGKNYAEYVRVYIDFNNDGDFEDAGEMVWFDTKNKREHYGQISIPLFPETGAILRMRVMSDYDSLTMDPCDTLKYGQTEDYGLRIKPRKPTPVFKVDRSIVCTRDIVTLTDSSFGPIQSYVWVISGKSGSDTLSGKGPHQYQTKDSGAYTVKLILNDGLAEKAKDSFIYAKPIPDLYISVSDGDDTMCSGQDLVIKSVDSNGVKDPDQQWYQASNLLSGADESEIAYYPATTGETGTYFMVADKDGCIDTSNVLDIVIKGSPLVDYSVDEESQCVAYNEFSFTNKTTVPGNPTTDYTWTFGDGSSSVGTDAKKTYSDAQTYDVTLHAVTVDGCEDSATSQVKVRATPEAGFTLNDADQCSNDNEIDVSDTTNYPGNYTINWDLGDGNTSTNARVKHRYNGEGQYPLMLIASGDNGCIDSLIVPVTIHPQPNANFSINDNLQCEGDNLFDFLNTSTISSGTITSSLWNSGEGYQETSTDFMGYHYAPVGKFQVSLVVTSDQGCVDSISRLVQVGATPKADFVLDLSNDCFNQHKLSLSDKSMIEQGTIDQYIWNYGDGNTATGSGPSPYSYSAAGNYDVELVAVSDLGCRDSVTQSVNINPSPSMDFKVDIVCEGTETEFQNTSTVTDGSIQSYFWEMGDGSVSVDQNPVYTYDAAGKYDITLIGSSDKGCSDTMVRTGAVIVLERPIADFEWKRTSSWESSTEIGFMDRSKGNITDWEWDIETYGLEYVQNPMVWFNDTGNIDVQLIVTNELGCTDTTFDNIFVYPETNILVPNSFSPNGDGLNDKFGVVGSLYASQYIFEVYNRWGAVMFSTKDPDVKWDGKYKGDYVQPGMYLYHTSFVDLDGKQQEREGTVTIVR